MENQLVWNNRYNVGVDVIDKEHKKLFRILNKLFAFGQQETKRPWVCQETVKYFKDHALRHFQDEEEYMVSVGYTGLKTHMRIHKNFRETTLPALEKELELAGYSEEAVNHFLGVCAGWLIGHTLIEDQAIVSGEEVKQWENLLPEEEQAMMGQTVASILHSMFRLNPQLISNYYAGEQFGRGICCRLVYSDGEKKSWEFLLLFEEQLVGSIIGNAVSSKSETTAMMLSNVASYAATQLVERVRRYFPSLKPLVLKEEQILTYEQFYRMYERLSPQFSFLFDTGKGYFAYCMAASHMPLSGDGITAVAKDAVAALESRLRLDDPLPHPCPDSAVEAEADRRKILVVDDSDFMRRAMLDLLGRDYEVLTADSSMSAIRSITLARPDLVLLDYEMPVCNGGQMLEMIRSEKEFADIPVIFLTCRVDRASVEKAISLKPEGYLSKSLSAESVKREIDRFFEKRERR